MPARRAPQQANTASAPIVAESIGDDSLWAARAEALRDDVRSVARAARAGELGPPTDVKALAKRIAERHKQ